MGLTKLGLIFFLLGTAITGSYLLASPNANNENVEKPAKQFSPVPTVSSNLPVATNTAMLAINPRIKFKVSPVTIIDFVDPNTLRVLIDKSLKEINLLGISQPTSSQLVNYKSCNGEDVLSSIQRIVLGKKAFILDDSQFKSEDNLSKYVFLEDLTFLNLELIKKGLARVQVTNSGSNYLYIDDFKESMFEAQNQKIGIWSDICDTKPTPTTTPKLVKIPTKKPPIPTPTPTKSFSYTSLLSQSSIVNSFITIYPTLSPSPTPTPKPTSTPKPTPTPTPRPPIVLGQTNLNKPSSLNPEILFVLINNHRKEIGKPPFQKDEQLCKLAVERGPELYDEIFVTGKVHSGLYDRDLPYWITENMAHYPTEEQVFSWWMGSSLHRRAIEGDNKYSCGECYGNSCAQLFTSYIPK